MARQRSFPLLEELGFVHTSEELAKAIKDLPDLPTQDPAPARSLYVTPTAAIQQLESPDYGPSPLADFRQRFFGAFAQTAQEEPEDSLGGYPVKKTPKMPLWISEATKAQQAAQDARQKKLEALTTDERGFVQAALATEKDVLLWDQLADYLLDQGMETTARRIRDLRPLLEIKRVLAEYEKELAKQRRLGHERGIDLLRAHVRCLQWVLGIYEEGLWIEPYSHADSD